MAAFFYYASFPNSRIKPRPSTSQALTYHVTLDVLANPPTLIAAEDLNRTYLMIKNLDAVNAYLYVYAEPVAADPTLTATLGVQNQLVLFGAQLYQKQDSGITVNWVAVNFEDVAENVDAGQTATLDSPGSVYGKSSTVASVDVGVDGGIG